MTKKFAILLALTLLVGGCNNGFEWRNPFSRSIPVVFNEEQNIKPDYRTLRISDRSGMVYGMVTSSGGESGRGRIDYMLSSVRDNPFAKYEFRLRGPFSRLSDDIKLFFGSTDSGLIGPAAMLGKIKLGQDDRGRVCYDLVVESFEKVDIDSAVTEACAKAVSKAWSKIASYHSKAGKIGDFVVCHDPRVVSISAGGGQCLYRCAYGKSGVTVGRVFCLVDIKTRKANKIYVVTGG